MNARVLFPWLWLLVGVAFVMLVWPTRWRYDRITIEGDVVIVRLDRRHPAQVANQIGRAHV